MKPSPNPEGLFAPTRWSLVSRAQGTDPVARKALADLCEAYWPPVFRFLRRRAPDEDSARERTQAFFAHVLEGGRLDGANPAHGRFRSYLLTALRHFEARRHEHDNRLCRGGGAQHVPLEPDMPEAARPQAADALRFDHEWAVEVVRRAFAVLAAEYAGSGRSRVFDLLKPALGDGELPSQAELAALLGITEGAVKVAIHRLRHRFREQVRIEIAGTVPAFSDIDEELRHLVEVLSAPPPSHPH